jgi:ribosomal protein L34E
VREKEERKQLRREVRPRLAHRIAVTDGIAQNRKELAERAVQNAQDVERAYGGGDGASSPELAPQLPTF